MYAAGADLFKSWGLLRFERPEPGCSTWSDKPGALAIRPIMTFNVSKTVCMIFKPLNSRYAIFDIFQHSMRVSRYSFL